MNNMLYNINKFLHVQNGMCYFVFDSKRLVIT